MNSFSNEVKKELSEKNNLKNKELVKAELIGYYLTNSSNIYKTESKYNINRYSKLLNNIKIEDYNISIDNRNIFSIKTKQSLEKIVESFLVDYENNLEKYINSDEEKEKALLRGVFLGSGTISNPKNGYHIDIKIEKSNYIDYLTNILKKYSVKANVINRKKNYLIYIEEGESISNFLALIGANSCKLQFENERIIKEFRNNVNRQVNLETANIKKVASSSVRKIEDIKLIKEKNKFNLLSDKEQEVANIRLKNKEASLDELKDIINKNNQKQISKSGVNHRLKKIEELANSIRKEEIEEKKGKI